jgi:ceramide glucosyltransferase
MTNSLDMFDMTLLALAVSSLGATFTLHWAVREKLRGATAARSGAQPGISIFKPLCGLDEGLYDNLVSFVEQAYPEFELILGVADPRDAVLSVVQRLRRNYPQTQIRLIVHGEEDLLANPKVISLIHMARAARYEHWLVSDSNVRAAPNYLAAVAAEMSDPNVGLVSNVIVGSGEDSLGAQCENLHLNTFVLGGVCVADLADRPCVVGKSMFMRRSQLAALGGFDALREVLAEDFLLGQRFHAAGYRVVLSRHAVATHNRRLSVRRFLARHLRWAQLRRTCAPGPFCSELLLYASPWLLTPLVLVDNTKLQWLCMLGLCVRIANDGWLAKTVTGRWPSLRALMLLPVKDSLLLTLWTIAMFRRSVSWRGHALRIGTGSRLIAGPAERMALLRDRAAHAVQ